MMGTILPRTLTFFFLVEKKKKNTRGHTVVGSETLRSRSLPPPPGVGTASQGVIGAGLRESLETMNSSSCRGR